MRSRPTLLLALLVVASEAAGQCTDQTAWQKPGGWSRAEDTLAKARMLPEPVRTAALQRADAVLRLIERAIPDPRGVQAKAYRSHGMPESDTAPLKYGVTAFFLGYYCVPQSAGNRDMRGRILLGEETGTWIYLKFNDLSELISPISEKLLTDDGSRMFSLPRRIADFKGRGRHAWQSGSVEWEAILVKGKDARLTRDVTREEFLRARERAEHSSRSGSRTAQQRLTEIAALREGMTAAERRQPAVIVNAHAGNRDRMLFARRGERGERLFSLDPAFFDASLPRHAIQFAVILLRWEPRNPAKAEVVRRFRDNFDIEALQAMLGRS